jgi:hypothetical protein
VTRRPTSADPELIELEADPKPKSRRDDLGHTSQIDGLSMFETYRQKLTGTSVATPRVESFDAYLQGLIPPGVPPKSPTEPLFDISILGGSATRPATKLRTGAPDIPLVAWSDMPHPDNMINVKSTSAMVRPAALVLSGTR